LKKKIDLTGRRFDKIIVVAEVGRDRHLQYIWLCVCDCGNHFTRSSSNILSVTHQSKTKGCKTCSKNASAAARVKHGDARKGRQERLYSTWCGMRARCQNPNDDAWKYYGGKGVLVCAEWQDYPKFRIWAHSNGYQRDLTIERKNPNGHYEPSNCEWITASENIRRRNIATRKAAH
jgi:hypothetical protein